LSYGVDESTQRQRQYTKRDIWLQYVHQAGSSSGERNGWNFDPSTTILRRASFLRPSVDMKSLCICPLALLFLSSPLYSQRVLPAGLDVRFGGVVRTDASLKQISLVFTGHEFADGGEMILTILLYGGFLPQQPIRAPHLVSQGGGTLSWRSFRQTSALLFVGEARLPSGHEAPVPIGSSCKLC